MTFSFFPPLHITFVSLSRPHYLIYFEQRAGWGSGSATSGRAYEQARAPRALCTGSGRADQLPTPKGRPEGAAQSPMEPHTPQLRGRVAGNGRATTVEVLPGHLPLGIPAHRVPRQPTRLPYSSRVSRGNNRKRKRKPSYRCAIISNSYQRAHKI